jgi:hypothetical protein
MTRHRTRQLDWLAGDARFDWKALNSFAPRTFERATEALEDPINPDAPYELGLIACSASKLSSPAPAADLYTGALFRLSLAVARRICQRIRILSAKHEVVRLNTVLEPYDVSLASLQKHQRAIWGAAVDRALERWTGRSILCLAPAGYWRPVSGAEKWHRPLMGLGIGEQKARLAKMLADPLTDSGHAALP